jgi:hypothetical protein
MRARSFQGLTIIAAPSILLFLTAGCARSVRDPMPVCYAAIVGDTYAFSRRLAFAKPNLPIGELEVRKISGGSPAFLWRIELRTGPAVDAVTYGQVPSGYTQILPATGAPPVFQQGEEYELTCDNGLGRFVISPEGAKNLGPP